MPQLSLHSPTGPLTVSAEDDMIVALDWGWGRDQDETPLLRQACDWLDSYFDGDATACALPLAPYGTPQQVAAWTFIRTIPMGHSVSCAEVARQANVTPADVVAACSENPIPILIPCHRVDMDGCADYDPHTYPGDGGATDRLFLRELETRAPDTI
ncbi:methylated-DNA--[protein]-cysteine S-methyltransferase [Novacetimonas pomaceti]|uniref:methylated-DNA--[protein]-cysteine S-methyltransferase n=1 Tax=Novacetimonas pomaceti TaxID=2021998 RepID=UPI001C2D37C5|nr:methylated-DNA--[protein]-cysteine S-methyltransferase [Novacetimonas pomaceti]MBV1834854.1 methylated-DNA--[protein]-cysteine S-methyltransferase [Novacetimonas pomaceti]